MILSDAQWNRSNSFETNVILLDGLTGTGKTMVMKILDTYQSVTPPKFNYQLEQILIGIDVGEIRRDFGIQLLQLLLDQVQYDWAIGREINLRPKDLSSVLTSKKRIAYLKNLMKTDGNLVENRVKLEKQDLLLVTHQLIDAAVTVDHVPGKRLTHILCVRHPYFLLNHWVSYIPMHGNSSTDFTLVDGIKPWFIKENRDLYLQANTKERAMISIIELINKSLDYMDESRTNLIVLDFENFVLNPMAYLDRLSESVSLRESRGLGKVMRQQKLPRIHINDTLTRSIYKRYAADTLTTKNHHEQDYEIMRERSKEGVSTELFSEFENVAKRYENRFGVWF